MRRDIPTLRYMCPHASVYLKATLSHVASAGRSHHVHACTMCSCLQRETVVNAPLLYGLDHDALYALSVNSSEQAVQQLGHNAVSSQ